MLGQLLSHYFKFVTHHNLVSFYYAADKSLFGRPRNKHSIFSSVMLFIYKFLCILQHSLSFTGSQTFFIKLSDIFLIIWFVRYNFTVIMWMCMTMYVNDKQHFIYYFLYLSTHYILFLVSTRKNMKQVGILVML
jgi:hypothetical protein